MEAIPQLYSAIESPTWTNGEQFSSPTFPCPKGADIKAIAQSHQPTYVRFKGHRSEVIEAAIFIESRIDFLLCFVFAGTDETKCTMFRELVLEPESCSMMHKWKMLRGAIDMNGVPNAFPDDGARKAFFRALQTLISDRNQFAHGDLYIDARDGRPFIQYFEGGKKERYLTDDSMHGIIGSAKLIHEQLEKLIDSVQPPRN